MMLKPGMGVVVHPCFCLLREDRFFTEGEMFADITFFEVVEEPLARVIIKCQGREKALEMSTNGHVVLGDPEGKEFGIFFAAWTGSHQDVELVVLNPEVSFSCPRCGSEFDTWELFQAHVQEPHSTEEPQPCMGCGKFGDHLEGCTLAKAQEDQQ